MKTLQVTLNSSSADSRLMTYPVSVYAPDGSILGSGVVSAGDVRTIDYREPADKAHEYVYVVARRPDGSSLQQRVSTKEHNAPVILSAGSPEGWLDWATSFRSLSHLQGTAGFESVLTGRRIGKVWMKVWKLENQKWTANEERPVVVQQARGARQATLFVEQGQFLLQIGGENVAWRFLSLPSEGHVRVAVTRSAASEGDAVDITIGRESETYELLMAYLERGDIAEASDIAEAWHIATRALYKKFDDPVGAVAGAYVLLRLNQFDKKKREWLENLDNKFPSIPDGPLILAALELRAEDPNLPLVRKKIHESIQRGLPTFSYGLSLLVEVMAAIHRGRDEGTRFRNLYAAAQVYLNAKASRSPYNSFFGRTPTEPSPVKLYGVGTRGEVGFTGPLAYQNAIAVEASDLPKQIRAFGDVAVTVRGPQATRFYNWMSDAPTLSAQRALTRLYKIKALDFDGPLGNEVPFGLPAIESSEGSSPSAPQRAALPDLRVGSAEVLKPYPPRNSNILLSASVKKNVTVDLFDGSE